MYDVASSIESYDSPPKSFDEDSSDDHSLDFEASYRRRGEHAEEDSLSDYDRSDREGSGSTLSGGGSQQYSVASSASFEECQYETSAKLGTSTGTIEDTDPQPSPLPTAPKGSGRLTKFKSLLGLSVNSGRASIGTDPESTCLTPSTPGSGTEVSMGTGGSSGLGSGIVRRMKSVFSLKPSSTQDEGFHSQQSNNRSSFFTGGTRPSEQPSLLETGQGLSAADQDRVDSAIASCNSIIRDARFYTTGLGANVKAYAEDQRGSILAGEMPNRKSVREFSALARAHRAATFADKSAFDAEVINYANEYEVDAAYAGVRDYLRPQR